MRGDTFIRAWEAGDSDGHAERHEIVDLAMLLLFARFRPLDAGLLLSHLSGDFLSKLEFLDFSGNGPGQFRNHLQALRQFLLGNLFP